MSYPILFKNTELSESSPFQTRGLAVLQPLACVVTEERNGEYELEMDVNSESAGFYDLRIGRIIYAPHDSNGDWQPFEIYAISNQLNGIAYVNAWHVSYRLNKVIIKPFSLTSATPSDAISAINSNIAGTTNIPFSIASNLTSSNAFSVESPKTLREVLGGSKGSMLDVWGGEWKWDKKTCSLLSARGKDSGISLRYGTNITSMTREQSSEEIYTAVYPFWKGTEKDADNNDVDVYVDLPEGILYKSDLSTYYSTMRLTISLDMSQEFETQPTTTELRAAAQAWLNANAKTAIPEDIDVSFLQMDENGKAAVNELSLCDTLTVSYPMMGVNVSAKVTKVVYNVLLDRYDSISIGTNSKNMNTAIKKVVGIK